MSDRMTPVGLDCLLVQAIREYEAHQTVFGIPASRFVRTRPSGLTFFGERCALPLGPAAGPHTQLAQNIATAYLTGGRFFELKTVQKLDALDFEKPCIHAPDEAYNTEWSTELTLEDAFGEYVRARVLLYAMNHLFQLDEDTPAFVFNMSVGYDLAGIQTDRMDAFITGLIHAAPHPVFQEALQVLRQAENLIRPGMNPDLKDRLSGLKTVADCIPDAISQSVTLSTMHGCPPEEIEAIARYLMEEKGLHTYVKLNPTLLGYDTVRDILDRLGYNDIALDPEGFDRDLQWKDAVPMLRRLQRLAHPQGRQFGVKLSNTLAVKNPGGHLPGEEMYMSGRSLFPITLRLSARIAAEFGDTLPISYSGGAAAHNVQDLVAAGIRPVTCATELLKPGGYLRLAAMAEALQQVVDQFQVPINPEAITALADQAQDDIRYHRNGRPEGSVSVPGDLPLTDCFVAPCRTACAIGQDVPDYVKLVGMGRYADALSLIYEKNPLPHITGHICDHQCMFHCTRLDYDQSVQIRDLKRIAAERGYEDVVRKVTVDPVSESPMAAVIGAGPGGLAAAYFLAKAGCAVTVFEKEADAGGVVRHILPDFRLPVEALEKDIAFIQAHGVVFRFQAPTQRIQDLKSQGFQAVILATGAPVPRPLNLSGNTERMVDALAFLKDFRARPQTLSPGHHVVVVGGGNTAMDSARAALRLPGVETVTIIYRRTRAQMPADREEFDNALADGVRYRELLTPEHLSDDGHLTCRVMTLGDPGPDGRPRPLPTDDTVVLKADTVIAAIGETPDRDFFDRNGIPVERNGLPVVDPDTLEASIPGVFIVGDARRGPSTVVQSIADGRSAAEAAAKMLGRQVPPPAAPNRSADIPALQQERGRSIPSSHLSEPAFAEAEARRCLDCAELCNKCVEVCPNRANVLITFEHADGRQVHDILHLDALCNECGNCATFCPYENGAPYRDKLTLYRNTDTFLDADGAGFVLEETDGAIQVRFRVNGVTGTAALTEDGRLDFGRTALPDRICRFMETVITDFSYLVI